MQRFAAENVVQGARDYRQWCRVEDRLRPRVAALRNIQSVRDVALHRNHAAEQANGRLVTA